MKIYELTPMYDAHASFYGKAKIFDYDGVKMELCSFDTIVAVIDHDKATVYDTYSRTTLRHIKEFLKQNGFSAENKQQIIKDYMPV